MALNSAAAAARIEAQRKDGRPSDQRPFGSERGQSPAASTCVSGASAVALRAGCQRVRRDGNRRRRKNRTQSAASPSAMLHAHRPLGIWTSRCPIEATRRLASQPRKGATWYFTACSCATSDANESLPPEIESRHEAINQPINQSARTKQHQLASRSGNKRIRTRTNATSEIKYDLN